MRLAGKRFIRRDGVTLGTGFTHSLLILITFNREESRESSKGWHKAAPFCYYQVVAIYKTKAVVLSRRNVGEADQILTLYSEKFGKIQVKAKGIRKPLAKMTGFLEPLNLVALRLAEGKKTDIVTGVESLDFFEGAKTNLPRISAGYYFVELLESLVHDREKNIRIYQLLVDSLRFLASGANPHLLRAYFGLNLLALLGYRPELEKCLKCEAPVGRQSKVYFGVQEGGILCGKCRTATAKKIDSLTLKFLRFLLREPLEKVVKLKVGKKTLTEGLAIINQLICAQTTEKLKTPKFCQLVSG